MGAVEDLIVSVYEAKTQLSMAEDFDRTPDWLIDSFEGDKTAYDRARS